MLQPARGTSFIYRATVIERVEGDGGFEITALHDNTTRVRSSHGNQLTRCGDQGSSANSSHQSIATVFTPDFSLANHPTTPSRSNEMPRQHRFWFPFTIIIRAH